MAENLERPWLEIQVYNALIMMGHILTILVSMVREQQGEEAAARLFTLSNIEAQEFRTEIIYPDQLFQSLYSAAKKIYGVDDETAQHAFADYFMIVSPKLFPAIFKVAGNAKSLFEKVPTIHRQWPAAANEGAFQDKLRIRTSEPKRLVFEYSSPNRLCGVLRHTAERVLEFYGERGEVSETQCVRRGAPCCEVEVLFLDSTSTDEAAPDG